MKINFNYITPVTEPVQKKLEEAKAYLEEVLASTAFKEAFSKYSDMGSYLEKVNGFTVNVQIGGTPENRPFSYSKDKTKKLMSVNPSIMMFRDKKENAAVIGHEIGHQWFTHEEFGRDKETGEKQFLTALQEDLPKVKIITQWEKFWFWLRWAFHKITHGLVQSVSWPFWTVLILIGDFLIGWSIDIHWKWYLIMTAFQLNFLLGHFLRYHLQWQDNPFWWWLNDEEDVYVEWLEDNNREDNFWSAVKWNFRNMAWNFMKSIETPSHAEPYDILTVTDTLHTSKDVEIHKLTHANRDKGIYGKKHVYYRLSDGKVYGRYSHANKKKERMYGIGNQRYLLRRKPIF